VTHAEYEPWRSIAIEGQFPTWVSQNWNKVTYAQGKPVGLMLRRLDSWLWSLRWNKRYGRIILAAEVVLLTALKRVKFKVLKKENSNNIQIWESAVPDLDFLMSKKMETIFSQASLENVDFIIFTTTSSYLNVENLEKYLTNISPVNFAGGRMIKQNSMEFPSGSFRVFSIDVIKQISKNYAMRKLTFTEDMAVGWLLQMLNIKIQDIPSIDIPEIEDIDKLGKNDLQRIIHFRLKSGNLNLRNDARIMRSLHSYIRANSYGSI